MGRQLHGTVAFLPLDDRPPNVEYPVLLAEAAGLGALTPPKEWLGNPWRDGDCAALARWLEEVAPRVDAIIVAIDTLGYGGLVNSRRSSDGAEVVLARLDLLRRIKRERPALKILGYSVLMRISRHNSSEEEKPYWATHGVRLFRISYLADRLTMMAGETGDEDELAGLYNQVPPEIIEDYLVGRARNHAVNRAMIEWAAEGLFDYLIIPQDDTEAYGWSIAERRRLEQMIRRFNVADRVSTYPGADETDMLLLARYVVGLAGFEPRIWPRYSGVSGGQMITAYEDRPMAEMIKAHLGPLRGVIAPTYDQADIALFVNAPAAVQGEANFQYVLQLDEEDRSRLEPDIREAVEAVLRAPGIQTTLLEMNAVGRNVEEFTRGLARTLSSGKPCALVDVAYVNGADLALADSLMRNVGLSHLAAYGAWNTAGNSLGAVLAQSVVRYLQQQQGADGDALAAHAKLLFVRFVDDYLYQASVRSALAFEELPRLGLTPRLDDLGDQASTVSEMLVHRLTAAAEQLATDHFTGMSLEAGDSAIEIDALHLRNITLPWHRLFEMGCEVEVVVRGKSTP